MRIEMKGTARPSKYGKWQLANAMYWKGKNFLEAAILLRQRGGYEYVVLHLLCQGIEITLKSLLLFCDYDEYWPRLRGFGHDLEAVTREVLKVFGLNPLRPPLLKELRSLNQAYMTHILRYASSSDLLIAPGTISSHRILRRTMAALRLAERHLSETT